MKIFLKTNEIFATIPFGVSRRAVAISLVTTGFRQRVFAMLFACVGVGSAYSQPAALVKDIRGGSGSSDPSGMVLFGGQWYFAANDGVHGVELWKSDGTASGTVLVKDINPGSASSNPGALVAFGGILVFTATDALHGTELWRTDGTEAGTILVQDLVTGAEGSRPFSFLKSGSSILFLAYSKFRSGPKGLSGSDLLVWRTDGTTQGTVQVSFVGFGQSPTEMVPSGPLAFFSQARDGDGSEISTRTLYVTDGAETHGLFAVFTRWGLQTAAFKNALYFLAWDGAYAAPSGSLALWRTDGGASTETKVRALPSKLAPLSTLVTSGGRMFFVIETTSNSQELWASDGTQAGTHLVVDINPGVASSEPAELIDLGGTLLFTASDPIHGRELWRTNGTAPGTFLVNDILPGSGGSAPSGLRLANGLVYFSANDGTHGVELWRTDGATVELVQDIVPGPASSVVREVASGAPGLFLTIDDAVHGAEPWSIPSSALPLMLAIEDAQAKKPTLGQTQMLFTATLSKPSQSTVTAAYETVDGTAMAGRDYVAASGTVTFPPGETSRVISVTVIGGGGGVPTSSFELRLHAATGAGLSRSVGIGTVQSDVVPVVRSFTIDRVFAVGGGEVTLTWITNGSESVTISGLSNVFGPAGTIRAPFSGTTRFTLTATSPAGTAQASVTVNVLPTGGANLAVPAITTPVYPFRSGVAGVTFAWTPVVGAVGYDLRLFDDTTGATVFSGSLLGAGSTSALLHLQEGLYRFAVRGCTTAGFIDTGCGPFALSTNSQTVQFVRPAAGPSIGFPLEGATLTSSTQTLSWTSVAPDPALSGLAYEVVLRDHALGTTTLQITVPAPTLSTIFTMPSSSEYELKVRACQAGCGPWSTPVTFAVALPAKPATAPTISSCTVSGGNSLTCNWGAVSNADAYQVQVVQAPPAGPGGGALTVAAIQVSATTVTLPVPPGAATVFIAACNGDGCGPNATSGIVAGGSNPSQPNSGTPMAGTVVNGPGVLFTWNRVPGDTGSTLYRLFVQDLSRQATALDVFTANNFYSAYFRAEGARYDALVVANPGLTGALTGPAQGFNVAGLSSTAPTLVSPAHNSALGSGNIQLGWSPVPGATLYEYFVAVLGQGSASARGVTPALLAQVPLTGTGAGTVYSGIVRACPVGATCVPGSDLGWGPWSNAAGGPGVTNFTVAP